MHRLLPPHSFILLGLTAAALGWVVDTPILDSAVRWGGGIPLATGIALTVAGSRQFERASTNIKTFDEPDVLVTTGWFRWTRNPMYLGFLLALVGWALLLDRWIAFVAPAAFLAIADRWYIPFEEHRMAAAFGDDYRTYRARVRRWL